MRIKALTWTSSNHLNRRFGGERAECFRGCALKQALLSHDIIDILNNNEGYYESPFRSFLFDVYNLDFV